MAAREYPIKLFLDGRLIPDGDYEPGSVVINYERRTTEQGLGGGELGAAAGFVGSIEFFGQTAIDLRNKFIPQFNPNFRTEEVAVRIENACCPDKVIFEGQITFAGVQWCDSEGGGCKFSAPVRDTDPDALAFSCVKSVFAKGPIGDPSFFANTLHPFVRHANLTSLTGFFVIVAVLLSQFAVTLIPIISIVSIIVSAITLLLPGVPTVPPLITGFLQFVEDMQDAVIGVGKGHPSPLVTSYFDNICRQCGLSWQSSTFDPTAPAGQNYFNALYFYAGTTRGYREYIDNATGLPLAAVATDYFEKGAPTDTGAQFFDRICRYYNLNWWIEAGVVYIEAQPSAAVSTLNLDALPRADIQSVCYEFFDAKRPLSYEFVPAEDYLDGNSSLAKYNYGALVDAVAPPFPPGFEGKETVLLEFGASQFVNDNNGGDSLIPFAWLPFVSDNIRNADGYLSLTDSTASTPRLLLWDFADRNAAKFERVSLGGGLYSYNDRLKFTVGDTNAMLEKFWRRNFVDTNPLRGVEVTIELILRCEYLDDLAVNGNVVISGQTAVVQSYSIDADTIIIKARY